MKQNGKNQQTNRNPPAVFPLHLNSDSLKAGLMVYLRERSRNHKSGSSRGGRDEPFKGHHGQGGSTCRGPCLGAECGWLCHPLLPGRKQQGAGMGSQAPADGVCTQAGLNPGTGTAQEGWDDAGEHRGGWGAGRAPRLCLRFRKRT